MPKALIVYTSRSGNTQKIGEYIAEGLRFSGLDVEVVSSSDIKKERDLQGYDAYVFGSATYHGLMMKSMETMLFLAEKAGLKDKAGGAFGAFGWSGEAPERIFETMKNIFEMDMAGGPLMLKDPAVQGAIKVAQDYGREVAGKVSG